MKDTNVNKVQYMDMEQLIGFFKVNSLSIWNNVIPRIIFTWKTAVISILTPTCLLAVVRLHIIFSANTQTNTAWCLYTNYYNILILYCSQLGHQILLMKLTVR